MKKSERAVHFCVISSQLLQGDGANLMARNFRQNFVKNPNRDIDFRWMILVYKK
jgi:hypothetical protein